MAKPVPEGFNTVSAHIVVNNASEAIDFYKKAFGAEEVARVPGPDGKSVMHAELRIGTSRLMLNDEFPQMGAKSAKTIGATPVTLHLYVDNVDELYDRAVKAGAKVKMPVENTFWGDRYGRIEDPYGHQWAIATHKEDLTPQQLQERAAEYFSKQKPGA